VKDQDFIHSNRSTMFEALHLNYTTSGVASVNVLLKVCNWLLLK